MVSLSDSIAKAIYQHSLGDQKSLAIHSEQKIILKDEGNIILRDERMSTKQRVAALPILVKFPQGCLQKRLSELGVENLPGTAGYYLTSALRILSKGKI